jgi:putative peptidoglycan lipid II flippase
LGVFAIAISTAALPSLATEAVKKDLRQFQNTLNHALCLVFFITLPSMAGLIILGKPIIQILFERGAFDARSSVMTAYALFYYTLGLWAFSGIRIMVSAFYALQDTKTPVKVAVIALVVNLTLSLLLMGPLKHGGLALALSLASAVQFLLLVFFLKKKASVVNLRPVLISVSKSVLAASLMGLGVYYFNSEWLIAGEGTGLPGMVINLAALIVIGMIIYFGAARVLGCSEIASIMGMLSRKRKK